MNSVDAVLFCSSFFCSVLFRRFLIAAKVCGHVGLGWIVIYLFTFFRLQRLCVLVAVHGPVPCPEPAVAVSYTLGRAVANA